MSPKCTPNDPQMSSKWCRCIYACNTTYVYKYCYRCVCVCINICVIHACIHTCIHAHEALHAHHMCVYWSRQGSGSSQWVAEEPLLSSLMPAPANKWVMFTTIWWGFYCIIQWILVILCICISISICTCISICICISTSTNISISISIGICTNAYVWV